MTAPAHMLLENQLCLSLYSAANALTRAYGPLLRAIDLTYPQYLVMLALWAGDGLSVSDICARTRLDTGTVTPLLKRLEAKRLLRRGRSREDERKRVIVLTQKGIALCARAQEVPLRMACLGVLTQSDGVALKHLCETLFAGLVALEEGAKSAA